jgi:hypothetical protein
MVAIDDAGRLVQDTRFAELTGWLPRYLGQTGGGRFLFLDRTAFVPRARAPAGLVQQWSRLVVFDSSSRQVSDVDSIVLSEAFAHGDGFQRVTFGFPFAAAGDAVVAGEKLVWAFSRDSVAHMHDPVTGRIDTLPLSLPAFRVDDADWEERWDTIVARSANEFRDRVRAAKSNVPRVQEHPRFLRLMSTPRGTVAAYAPSDTSRLTYEVHCIVVAPGDVCPAVRTVPGEVVIAVTSGRAAVGIEQEDGTWRVVLRSAREPNVRGGLRAKE